MNAAAKSAPPRARSPPGWALSARTSSATTSRTMVVFQSAPSRVLEYTILGTSRQMWANSTMGAVLDGSLAAVGQNPAISS